MHRLLHIHRQRPLEDWTPPVTWVPLVVLEAILEALGLEYANDWLNIEPDRLQFLDFFDQDFDGTYDCRVAELDSFRIAIAVSHVLPLATCVFRSVRQHTDIWTQPRDDRQTAAIATVREVTAAKGGLLIDYDALTSLRFENGQLVDWTFSM